MRCDPGSPRLPRPACGERSRACCERVGGLSARTSSPEFSDGPLIPTVCPQAGRRRKDEARFSRSNDRLHLSNSPPRSATASRSRRACARVLSWRPDPEIQRAQGMPGARCARSLACEIRKHTSIVTTVTPVHPAFPAQWFYSLYRALPGDRAFLPPSLRRIWRSLTPASGRQDHTTSPSAGPRLRLERRLRPPHPAPRP
jgi:hypothetical protein